MLYRFAGGVPVKTYACSYQDVKYHGEQGCVIPYRSCVRAIAAEAGTKEHPSGVEEKPVGRKEDYYSC